ncbi:ABC transporter substrate-binding protein [Petrotoga sp. 9PWA.NaAc.5.4]|uniref:ABC transporter substrate-binding protein n=1 Tax=Petrotoga sp. 9PWA.NaAc.5.4 TaxID=1434328 RepID=UPI000CB53735|nr:ABC transporter substrate-binding protein [Petrotoga sp. 9PWA.NaAc.5.4]PNR95813.1 hypothetical protein X924_04240 [Petrotoga sp. 9PWA.NaAc.5.4]
MKFKNSFLIGMIVVCLSLVFGAQKTTLYFTTLFHSGDAQAMEKIVQRINQESDDMFVILVQGAWENYYAQLINQVVAGNAPQVGVIHSNMFPSMKDALTPLNASPAGNLLEKAGFARNDFLTDVWDSSTFDGKQYGIPLDTHMWAMWYNKDIFEKAGLDPENPPTNAEELKYAADKIKDAGYYAVHFAEDGLARKLMRAWYILYWQQGGELFDENYSKATFNNEKGLKALEYLVNSVQKWGWNTKGTDGFKQFAAGQLGILFAGNWYYYTAEEARINYGVAKIPLIFDKPATWGNSHNLVIPKQATTNPEIYENSIELIRRITELSEMWGIFGGHIPAYNDSRTSQELLNAPVWGKSLKVFSQMAEEGYLHYPPNHPKAAELENAIQVYIQQAYNGTLTPSEALRRAEAECNRILSEK